MGPSAKKKINFGFAWFFKARVQFFCVPSFVFVVFTSSGKLSVLFQSCEIIKTKCAMGRRGVWVFLYILGNVVCLFFLRVSSVGSTVVFRLVRISCHATRFREPQGVAGVGKHFVYTRRLR